MSADALGSRRRQAKRAVQRWLRRRPRLLLIGVILLGAWLRFVRLDWQDIWLDEAFSLQIASVPWAEGLAAIRQDVHPPLYYALLHLSISLFGRSAFALRLPSVWAAILALPAFYLLARTLRLSSFWSLLTVLLLAIAYFPLRFAQETRSYSLLMLLVLLSMLFFTRWRTAARRRDLILWTLTTLALLYTHYYSFTIPVAQALWLVWRRPRPISALLAWGGALLCVGLAYLPWLPILQQQTSILPHLTHQAPLSLGTASDLLYRFAGRSWALAALCCLLIALPACARLLGPQRAQWFGLARPAVAAPAMGLAALWLIVPLALPFLSSRMAAAFTLRNAIISQPALWLLAVNGWRWLHWRHTRGLLLALVLTLSLPGLLRYYIEPDKEQWRAVVAWIEQDAQPGDLLLFDNGPTRQPFEYSASAGLAGMVRTTFPNFEGDPAAFVRRFAADHPRIWLIATVYGAERLDWRLGLLSAHYRLVGLMPFTDVTPILLERRADPR